MRRTLRKIGLFIMQKWLIIPIIVGLIALAAVLLPRLSRYPDKADDGAAWDKSWEMLGSVMGVEQPGNGFTLLNNDTALAGDGTYYASWVAGESTDYTNAQGKHVDLYPAQIYVLVYACADEETADEAIADWKGQQEETYQVRQRLSKAFNGQEYALLVYECGSDTNPYERGVSGFSRLGKYAVLAELTCTAGFQGDAMALLEDFLNGCHYGGYN